MEETDTEDKGNAENTTYSILGHRGISSKTFAFYGVKTQVVDDIPSCIGFKYPNGAVQKKSLITPKGERGHWKTEGDYSNATLFGKDKFEKGSREYIIITEGALDAMSAHEMLLHQYASVSVRSSSTAFSDLSKEYEYVNSFNNIVICLDGDEAGKKATQQISSLFDFNKTYFVELTKYKDANEYLANKDVFDFRKAVDGAKRYSPNNIISTFDQIRNALMARPAKSLCPYPFDDLQSSLRGLHRGEFIVMKGKQGIGKTELCRAIIDKALKETEVKIATVFLEEGQDVTIKGIATYELKMPAMSDDSGLSDEQILEAYQKAVKNDDSRLFIHTHISGDDENELSNSLRFLVKAAGVDIVFVDNLTMLNTGREGEDERLRIDRTIRRLRNLVNELEFCLVLIAHTNDDGTTRGSRLPDILANTVILLEREKPEVTLHFKVDKARTQGSKEGAAGFAIYDTTEYVLKNPEVVKSNLRETLRMPNL